MAPSGVEKPHRSVVIDDEDIDAYSPDYDMEEDDLDEEDEDDADELEEDDMEDNEAGLFDEEEARLRLLHSKVEYGSRIFLFS